MLKEYTGSKNKSQTRTALSRLDNSRLILELLALDYLKVPRNKTKTELQLQVDSSWRATTIQLRSRYNGIGTSRPIFVIHLSYLVRRCYVWKFNKIFEESLMVLTLVAYPSKLFRVTHFRALLSWVLARRGWIKQNTISIGEKLLVAICSTLASSEPLFFHCDLQIIWDCFIILTLT